MKTEKELYHDKTNTIWKIFILVIEVVIQCLHLIIIFENRFKC